MMTTLASNAVNTVHEPEVEWEEVFDIRGGSSRVKRLLNGDPDSPENFQLYMFEVQPHNRGLSVADLKDADVYHTPKHKHNFEQLRIILDGKWDTGKQRILHPGDVGYFPEGAYYGPENIAYCLMAILQFGGPSLEGYLAYDQLRKGHKELSEQGEFEDGLYYYINENGQKRRRDSYEAIWEHARGRRLTYPEPRFLEPVIMKSDAARWMPTDQVGVEQRVLGTFTEARLGLRWLRIAAGDAYEASADEQNKIVFLKAGILENQEDGSTMAATSATFLERGSHVALRGASDDVTVLEISMPNLEVS